MSDKCYSYYMHLSKLEGSNKQDIFVPARCKSWGCESCRRIKARLVMNFIKRSFANQKLYMLTVTDPHRGNALDAWKTLGSRWNLFRTWATKTFGKFQYVRVVEPHKKGGWPHMHILVNVDMSEAKIRKHLTSWGYGYIFDKMEISAIGASQYVSGYLTKKWPGTLANSMRQSTKTRIVQASQSLGPIFSIKSSWVLDSREIPASDVLDYVWDAYKARFINHVSGARMKQTFEFYLIESKATQDDRVKYYKMLEEAPELFVDDVEQKEDLFIGIQQSLIIP